MVSSRWQHLGVTQCLTAHIHRRGSALEEHSVYISGEASSGVAFDEMLMGICSYDGGDNRGLL